MSQQEKPTWLIEAEKRIEAREARKAQDASPEPPPVPQPIPVRIVIAFTIDGDIATRVIGQMDVAPSAEPGVIPQIELTLDGRQLLSLLEPKLGPRLELMTPKPGLRIIH